MRFFVKTEKIYNQLQVKVDVLNILQNTSI